MKFPVSAPGSHPIQETFFVDFRCRRFDGVYPAIDSSTPLRVTAGGAKDDSGRGSVEMASVAD